MKLNLNDVPKNSSCKIVFLNNGNTVRTLEVSTNLTKMLITFLKDTEAYSGTHFENDLKELGIKIVLTNPPS